MGTNITKVGNRIACLRKQKGLTQAQLAERLGVTFQAVSKWERAECLPDSMLLVDLANILETSVDGILTAGERTVNYNGKITVEDMRNGLLSLKRFGELIGKNNILYRCAVDGINNSMNTEIEDCFTDEYSFEAFLAEAIIQNLMAGKYIDPTDVRKNFRQKHFSDIVVKHAEKYGIK